jgi:N-formylglutamate amidohydrolase
LRRPGKKFFEVRARLARRETQAYDKSGSVSREQAEVPMDEIVRSIASDFEPPVETIEPARLSVPLIFSSPHSGAIYPERFLAASRLDPLMLRRSEDAFVDELFLPCVALGAPLLRANFPRAYLDVNREPYEFDPKVFEGSLPDYANSRSLRVAVGLGTIPRVVGDAQPIYHRLLSISEGLGRVEALYRPYHDRLRALVERAQRRFGLAVLVDCHSMPSNAADVGGLDIVLGDRYGASAAPAVVEILEARLRAAGYRTRRNKPFAGGFITEHFGAPDRGIHAIQIEIARALYLDERTLVRNERWTMLRDDLFGAVKALASQFRGGLRANRLAAE